MNTKLLITMVLSWGLAAMALADDALQLAPCEGSYLLHFGKGQAAASGFSMPVGTQGSVPAEVRMGQCGREMVLTVQGQPVVMHRSVQDDAVYVGSVTMGDGVARELTLTRGADRNLRGGLVASDGQLRITRPVWVMAQALQETVFEGCLDDPADAPPRRVSGDEQALQTVLQQAGYVPEAGFDYFDYITPVRAAGGEVQTRAVSVPLNAEGRMLPRSDVALARLDREKALCSDADYLDPARFFLDFKITEVEDAVIVFARVIDIETGKIKAQVEGRSAEDNPKDVTAAMAAALAGLDWPVGAMKGSKL